MKIIGKASSNYQQYNYGAIELSQQQKDRIRLSAGLEKISAVSPEPSFSLIFIQPHLLRIEQSEQLIRWDGPESGKIMAHMILFHLLRDNSS